MGTYTSSVWKVSKYDIASGPYFPVFSEDTGKCGAEKTPYLDTFKCTLSALQSMFLKTLDETKKIHIFKLRKVIGNIVAVTME